MALFLRLTLVFIGWFSSAALAQTDLSDCFHRMGNSDIFFYEPFKREWRIASEDGCLPLCVKFAQRCKTVVYDSHAHTCSLYDQDGSQPPAYIMSAYKKTLFRVDNQQCLESQGRNVQFLGARVLVPVRNSAASESTNLQPTDTINSHFQAAPTESPRPEPSPTTSATPAVAFDIEEDTCITEGETPLFVAFENTEMLTGDSAEPNFITNEEECRAACELGQNVNTSETFTCHGFTHHADDGRCVIHRKLLNPPAITLSTPTSSAFSARSYMKFCYPLELEAISQCAHPYFIGFREYAMVGSVREEFMDLPGDYSGLKTCVELCVQSPSFLCHSASFFLDSGKCLLHDQSSLSDPQNFIEHQQPNQLYFENGCVSASLLNKDGDPVIIKTDRIRQEEEQQETIVAPQLASVSIRRSPQRARSGEPFGIKPVRVRFDPYASLYTS
uniref:Apple domain-containing protein n=1 Tax=Plectus sambesii TaxID=2011161 RepID=A0A914WX08_9BILA